MKFLKKFCKKQTVDKEEILKFVDKDTVVNFLNIHGDEETCLFINWSSANRTTNDINDITRYYLYDVSFIKYIIRIKSKLLIDNDRGTKIPIDEEFIKEITEKLKLLL